MEDENSGSRMHAPSTNSSKEQEEENLIEVFQNCRACAGLTYYTRAMYEAKKLPTCVGIEGRVKIETQESSSSREKLTKRLNRSGPKAPEKPFIFVAFGFSIYNPTLLYKMERLPIAFLRAGRICMSFGKERETTASIANESSHDPNASEAKERKEIYSDPLQGFQQKWTQLAQWHEEMMLDLQNKDKNTIARRVLKYPLSGVNGMYQFWTRRLENFGEKYTNSVDRIFAQMKKQLEFLPKKAYGFVHDYMEKDKK